MNIVIFGASGGTGQELIRQSLEAGHTVTAVVRKPDLVAARPRLTALAGDVYRTEDVAAAITGKDAVLAALGARALGKSDLLEVSTTHIVAAMQREAVRRLIALGAAGASGDAFRYQSALSRFLFTTIGATLLKWPFRSQRAMHRIIMGSGLEWTIVEPPRLLNGPPTGKYRVQADAMPPKSSSIHRGDVADFMLKQLTSKEWVGKTPFIAD